MGDRNLDMDLLLGLYASGMAAGMTTTITSVTGVRPERAYEAAEEEVRRMLDDPVVRTTLTEQIKTVARGGKVKPQFIRSFAHPRGPLP